jgi:excisionase family DNA binding protein
MTKISIPAGTNSAFRIPAKPGQPEKNVERIGVSAETAAEMLGVGVRTMWTLAKEQKIRTVRIGTRVIFSVQSLREFIDGKPAIADTKDIACVAEGKE